MSGIGIKIRKVLGSDYKDISYLCEHELGYICDNAYLKSRLENLNYEHECVLVAVIEEKIVGFVHIEKYDLLYMPNVANILCIAVLSKFHRKGIGRELLKSAEMWAVDKKIESIRLNSSEKRCEAHMFYRSMGYIDSKKQLRFVKFI